MVNPQKEKGYTPIAHEILEEVAKRKFTSTQHSILLIVWRMTYGFHRKDHELAVNYFVKQTGFSKRGVRDAISQLLDANVLTETQQASYKLTRKIAFNKRYDNWMIESRTPNTQGKEGSPGEAEFPSPGEAEFPQERYIKILERYKEEDRIIMEKVLDLLQKSKILEKEDITEFILDDINDVIDKFGFENPEEMIVEAIKDSARGNGKTWKYVYIKLNEWKKAGIKSIDELEKYLSTNDHYKKKFRKSKGGTQSNGTPERTIYDDAF